MSHQDKRTVVITGGSGGIGYHSALGIAQSGARVVITGRNQARGEAAQRQLSEESNNTDVEFVIGDLSSIAGIDALAHKLLARCERIDVLVNNAGYLGSVLQNNEDGFEMHFAVNVLAPHRLTLALLPALKMAEQARVLNITGGDKPARIDADNLQAEKGFKGLMTYTHSKSILEAMSLTMAESLQHEGVFVNLVFPGRASTAMTRSLSPKALPGLMKLMYPFFRVFFKEDGGKSAAKAARSTIWAATNPALEGVAGQYFDTHMKKQKLHPTAYDTDIQAKILGLLEGSAHSEG